MIIHVMLLLKKKVYNIKHTQSSTCVHCDSGFSIWELFNVSFSENLISL